MSAFCAVFDFRNGEGNRILNGGGGGFDVGFFLSKAQSWPCLPHRDSAPAREKS